MLEEAVNLAFEGRPGPVHIHVPENLTHHSISVDNYRDIDLDVKPMLPDAARVAGVADLLADALSKGKKVLALIGFGAVRSNAGPELQANWSSATRSRSSRRSTARASFPKTIRCRSGCSATAATRRRARHSWPPR